MIRGMYKYNNAGDCDVTFRSCVFPDRSSQYVMSSLKEVQQHRSGVLIGAVVSWRDVSLNRASAG